MAPASVELDEAVPLLGAYACRLAADLSVRALLIKGAPATAHGVRADRPSIDVDLWVDPAGISLYQRRLEERGWRAKSEAPVGWGHALTMVSPDWACAVDLHQRFPGFLADDADVFDLVWQGRAQARVGHLRIDVPSRVVAAAITVLHAERSRAIVETADDRSLALAAAGAFTAAERSELGHLVTATGSAEPLRDLTAAAGVSVPDRSATPPSLESWHLRIRAEARPGGAWLLALRRASWSRRPLLLLAATKPSDRDYDGVGAGRGRWATVRATGHRGRRVAGILLSAAAARWPRRTHA